MNFEDRPQLGYDRTLFKGLSIAELISMPYDRLPTSGLADLRESLLIIEDCYRNMPALTVKEKDLGTVDPVYLETTGRDTFTRVLEMPVWVDETIPQTRRERYGETTLRPIVLSFATVTLASKNYYPRAGDLVLWVNQLLEITRVYVDPKDYFRQTTFPLYVRCDTRVSNYDSRDLGNHCGSTDTGAAGAGAPSASPPSDQGAIGGTFRYDEPSNWGPLPTLMAPSE